MIHSTWAWRLAHKLPSLLESLGHRLNEDPLKTKPHVHAPCCETLTAHSTQQRRKHVAGEREQWSGAENSRTKKLSIFNKHTEASWITRKASHLKMLSEQALHHTSTTWVSRARSFTFRARRDRLPRFSRETHTHSRSGAERSGAPAMETSAQHMLVHLRRESDRSRMDTQPSTCCRPRTALRKHSGQDILVQLHQQP